MRSTGISTGVMLVLLSLFNLKKKKQKTLGTLILKGNQKTQEEGWVLPRSAKAGGIAQCNPDVY